MSEQHDPDALLSGWDLWTAYAEQFGDTPMMSPLRSREQFDQAIRTALESGVPDPDITFRCKATRAGCRVD